MNEPNVTTLPKLLNESQAAAYLGFSKATLVRLRKAQRISHIALSVRMIRYRKDQLDAFIAAREVQCQNNKNDSGLGNSGSTGDPTVPQTRGKSPGTTQPDARLASDRLAHQILNGRKPC